MVAAVAAQAQANKRAGPSPYIPHSYILQAGLSLGRQQGLRLIQVADTSCKGMHAVHADILVRVPLRSITIFAALVVVVGLQPAPVMVGLHDPPEWLAFFCLYYDLGINPALQNADVAEGEEEEGLVARRNGPGWPHHVRYM